MSNLPGIERELFSQLPQMIGNAIETYWTSLQQNTNHCKMLAKARVDPYNNRIDPLRYVISYFSNTPHQSAGSLFEKFKW
jgi:hypothetical protein